MIEPRIPKTTQQTHSNVCSVSQETLVTSRLLWVSLCQSNFFFRVVCAFLVYAAFPHVKKFGERARQHIFRGAPVVCLARATWTCGKSMCACPVCASGSPHVSPGSCFGSMDPKGRNSFLSSGVSGELSLAITMFNKTYKIRVRKFSFAL